MKIFINKWLDKADAAGDWLCRWLTDVFLTAVIVAAIMGGALVLLALGL